MIEESKELVTNDDENEIVETEINELKQEVKKITDKVLTGKCPIKVFEKEGNVNWEAPMIRDGFDKAFDVCKHLTATTDSDLSMSILSSGVYATVGENNTEKYNITLQALADSEPKDATESKLCLQAHALYTQGMKYLALSEVNNKMLQADFCLKNATKLLRLHNETIEALSKYRRGGEQRVIVQHVQVNDGGKAIVGNMIAGGGGK